MRILFDCRPVRDPISGVARYCLGLSEALIRTYDLDIDLFVQAQGGTNRFLDLLPPGASQRQSTLFANRKIVQNALLEYLPFVEPMLIGGRHQVLHETYFANIGTRRGGAKIATIHDVIPLERPELFSKRLTTYSERNFYRQAREADAIIAVSEYTRQRILHYAPEAEGKISVIGNGVDSVIVNGPKVTPLAARDPLAERPFVGFVGNIEPRKNLITLARGFDLAFPEGSDWRLVFAGRENFEAKPILEEIMRILGDRFLYLGPVSEERKWQVLAHARATAMTSEYEGFGIPIYESYAVSTPVMIADNSSMTELAVRPEQLFPTKDAEALSAGFQQIAYGADWVAESLNAGRAAVQKATWDHIAKETKAIYDKFS